MIKEIEKKYGFPIFCELTDNVYLGNSKKLIISDIWSFWDYVIKKKGFEQSFMCSLLEQAKHFYETAESSPMKSKPLLYYYSFLNLAKVMINIEKNYGSSKRYMHGIKEDNKNHFHNSDIIINPKKVSVVNVSAELLEVFDDDIILTDKTINVKSYLSQCVGIHRAYSEIYKTPETLYKLGKMILYKNKGKILGIKAEVQCLSSDLPALLTLGYNIVLEDNKYYWIEEIVKPKSTVTRNDYYNLAKILKDKGIWYYIGNSGYIYYISTNMQSRYKPEITIYNTMFYLGSITRYNPYLFDKMFSDKDQWLVSEFLTTQPKQFLYLATAKILGQSILKAYTSF
ncbi:YaaC family protein [uncultured Chryseobacterium sp.]|uniref:YaaC family protein n=1 Tax=uncultured Chryseobacterium sp. TaxID=259322 RepID=UPI0025E5A88F|nr:YaaC family protein [uncultured Chryseobacterium sp.]